MGKVLRSEQSATVLTVGRPLAGVPGRQLVCLDVYRETGVVTKVGGRAAVVSAVTDADRVVIEDLCVAVRA